MKKINKRSTAKIREIFKTVNKITVYTHRTNYEPETISFTQKDLSLSLTDILDGFAVLYKISSNQYKLQYAGECYWELETR